MAKLEELELKHIHRRSLAAKARNARTLDRLAGDALRRLERGEGNAADHQRTALEALDRAIQFKRDLFTELMSENLLFEKDDKCKKTGGRALAIAGTDGPDVIRGTAGPDLICAGRGNDRIFGRGGNDILLGGDGNDVIDAGAGKDIVSGGLGTDRIRSGPGRDRVNSGPGRDTVDGKRERRP
jgi:Ca2+-binding RTX toxin-like protein